VTEYEVVSDPAVICRALAIYALSGALLGVLGGFISIAAGGASAAEAGVVAAVVAGVWFVAKTCTLPWWWYKAGRSRYAVRDGQLRVWIGSHMVGEMPAQDAFYMQVDGRIDIKTLLRNGFGIADFPRATFRGAQELVGPPVLLWHDSRRSLHDLQTVVNRHVDARRGQLGEN
jgi:hypothetical protein